MAIPRPHKAAAAARAAALVLPCLAAALEVPNPSFEAGAEGKPEGWTSAGTVEWGSGPAADGQRYASLRGVDPKADNPGTGNGAWRSVPVAFQPGETYELRLTCRCRPETLFSGAYAVVGTGFVHRELPVPTDVPVSQWQVITARFTAPTAADAARSPIALSQWAMKGWLDVDAVEVLPVKLAHATVDGMLLGEGESIAGNAYEFRAPYDRWANVSRPLHGYQAYFHHNRWRLNAADDYVVYRHELAGRKLLGAAVTLDIWWQEGISHKVRVEAGTDGTTWQEIGVFGVGQASTCAVPAGLLPAPVLYVRLGKDTADASKPGLFQISGYGLKATVDGAPVQATGRSSSATVLGEDAGLEVAPVAPAPGSCAFAVQVRNARPAAVRLSPVLAVSREGAAAVEQRLAAADLPAGQTAEFSLPYGTTRSGQYTVEFRLGDGLGTRLAALAEVSIIDDNSYGERLPSPDPAVGLWWATSGWKVSRTRPLPAAAGTALRLRLAASEAEGAQLVVRSDRALTGLTAAVGELRTVQGNVLPAAAAEVLRVRYVHVDQASDAFGGVGDWPDPLPPFRGGIAVAAGRNQPLWVRVTAPKDARPGLYRGAVTVQADGFQAQVPIEVEVFGFTLPDETACRSLFGLGCWGPGRIMSYHRVQTEADRHAVWDMYLRTFAEHRISPYNPALAAFKYTWDTGSPWDGGKLALGEQAHTGNQALCLEDASTTTSVQACHREPLAFSGKPVRMSLWYRTAKPDEPAEVILQYLDQGKAHIAYRNQHLGLPGTTAWTRFERTLDPPPGAAFVQLVLEGAPWTPAGEKTGTAWMDDLSLTDTGSGAELLADGGFEAAKPIGAEARVTFDCQAWDAALARATKEYHFSNFVFGVPGLGGGTFYARAEGELLGFRQGSPEYQALFKAWCDGARAYLADRGLLDKAVCYPFDEPGEKDYPFVVNQLRLLKENFPGLRRMVPMNLGAADVFVGSVDFWCPILSSHNPKFAQERRQAGDVYTWYICCGPKAPYVANFIDRAGTDLRVWLWQTWQHEVDGVLIWDSTWWTSGAAYPDSLQDPYQDSMSWVDGYGTPRGAKRAWNAGDGRFLYPPEACFDGGTAPVLEGPVSSIRWEALRDGMEDFVYLAMLKRLLAGKRATLSVAEIARYEALLVVPPEISKSLTDWTKDPAPIEARRQEIAKAIEALAR
jgi:hypothetical protein